MHKGPETTKKVFLYICTVILTVVLLVMMTRVFSVIMQIKYSNAQNGNEDQYAYRNNGLPEYFVNGDWYIQKNNVDTLLLFGIDKYDAAIRTQNGYRNTQQADALFLLVIDNDAKSYSIIHINRDTMAKIRALDIKGNPYNTFDGQIAISHTYGSGKADSCENVMYSVSDYLYGLQIDNYMSLSMDAVQVINDAVGGVTLTIQDDMTPVNNTWTVGKEVTLMGEDALLYVRSRGGLADSTNLTRMSRQRQYIMALFEQAKKKFEEDDSLFIQIYKNVSSYMYTDYSPESAMALADVIKNYNFEGIKTIDGTAIKGERFMEYYTNEDALRNLIVETFYNKKYNHGKNAE